MKQNIYPYILGFLIALGGAFIANLLHIPLPWLMGPLIATAITTINGAKSKSHPYFRYFGQWVIGISLGLYFTPSTMATVMDLWHYIIMGCFIALLMSMFNAFSLYRWGRVDFKTAWFAGTVGGASEMANLAERYHAQSDRVASSHSVRVLIVVLVIPFVFRLLDIHGTDAIESDIPYQFSLVGLSQLLALTLIAGFIFIRFNMPNSWVLGPLLVTLILTSHEVHLTHLSPEIRNLGQLCIGWSLGSKYTPNFFSKAPRYISVSVLISLASLLVCAGFAFILSWISGIPVSTLILSLSPGGITEMTITAKVLMLGVPTVAAFHIARMVFILLTAQPCYKLLNRYIQKRHHHHPIDE
ncbi:AbrB family transcriptional regulator [Pelistega ratti]|uniref:AbrB family transcriptional regulator n=1 Tax=Pelistega ratti TaxID=2652177 RepID=UPI001952BE38|nr:AbrB family transcriptional regulator [Pelistega ratti]